MKDKIKKKIAEEAERYSSEIYPIKGMENLKENCKTDLTYGAHLDYSLAQQSVNSELLEAVREIQNMVRHLQRTIPIDSFQVFLDYSEELIQSASQNQQNEKESDSVEFANFINEKEFEYGTLGQWHDDRNEYSTEELYELFLQSKTNTPKEKI